MNTIVALVAAIGIATAAPICTEEKIYDEEDKMCIANEEDVWYLQHLRCAEGRVRGQKTQFLLRKIPFKNGYGKEQWLRDGEVWSSFMSMIEAAKKEGFNIGVNSAYRTWKHQMRLWREMPQVASNPNHAGERSHMTGYAVDFSGTIAFVAYEDIDPRWFSEKWARPVEGGFEVPTRFFWWLRKNAHKYGFKMTVPDEWWHWKHVGKDEDVKLVNR